MSLILGQLGTSVILAFSMHSGTPAYTDLSHHLKERESQTVQITQSKKLSHYKVEYGDTLSHIALEYGTTVNHLKEINKLSDSVIISGDTINVDTKRLRTSKRPSVRKEVKVKTAHTARANQKGRTVTMEVTAYTSAQGTGEGLITASGSHVSPGRTIAASPEFPFGTKMRINGHVYTVEDRGGAVKRSSSGLYRVDIYMTSIDQARQWGRRTLQVTILD